MRWLDVKYDDPEHMIRVGHPVIDYWGWRPAEEPKL